MNIIPLNSRVVLKKIEKKKHSATLILLEETDDNPTFQVIRVASDVKDVKEGDHVICNKYALKSFIIDDHEVFITHVNEIIAITDNLIIEEQNGIL